MVKANILEVQREDVGQLHKCQQENIFGLSCSVPKMYIKDLLRILKCQSTIMWYMDIAFTYLINKYIYIFFSLLYSLAEICLKSPLF